MREQIIQLLKDEAAWAGPFLIMPDSRPRSISRHRDTASVMDQLRLSVMECRACPLSSTRNNVVFGEGNPEALLMFVGEGPGAMEDKTGRPFVGPAGELLSRIIGAMGLRREDVYIANIVKCRPPGNRDPHPDEIEACIGYLHAQIDSIAPKVIVSLGRIASQTLLHDETPISRLRGTFRDYQGIMVMPTFHPSYLLQNPSRKRDVWEDIKKVMDMLGLPQQHAESSGR